MKATGKKIGLVIQGPLLSIGRAGNNLHASPDQLRKEGGVLQYDCRENIAKLIKDFGFLFDKAVVSTWDNEVKEGDGWEGATLVSAPDPGGIKQEGHYKDNNKHRQFVSTLNGLLELEKEGIEYAVKVRTDQYMDIEGLLASFFAEMEKRGDNSRAIGATVVYPPTFLLHDLYFASTLKAMKEFCEAVIAYNKFEFISSVHREMVLKYAYVHYRESIGVPDSAYFPFSPPGGVSVSTRKIFDYMFANVFYSLDPAVFYSTLWRGAHYERDHVASLVEGKAGGKGKRNIPALIATDWKRYYHFRKEILGVPISFTDRARAVVGQWGWDLWNLLRKVVRMVR